MLLYFITMFVLSLVVARLVKMPYSYAAMQAFTASSNKCARRRFRGGPLAWRRPSRRPRATDPLPACVLGCKTAWFGRN
jgi:hypothetical protein